MGTVFTGMGGHGVQFLSSCRPLLLTPAFVQVVSCKHYTVTDENKMTSFFCDNCLFVTYLSFAHNRVLYLVALM